jgi:hypothetical protein
MDLAGCGIEMPLADTRILPPWIGDAVDGTVRIDGEVEQDLRGFPPLPRDRQHRPALAILLESLDVEAPGFELLFLWPFV